MEHKVDGCGCPGRTCRDCGIVQCIGYFPQVKTRERVITKTTCAPCTNQLKYAWAKANPEKAKASQKKYGKTPMRIRHNRTNVSRWYHVNHEALKERREQEEYKDRRRRYKAEHREEFRQYNKEWRTNHPDLYREYIKRFAILHPDRIKEINMARYIKRRGRKAAAEGYYTPEEWRVLKTQYNFKCLCCGKQEPSIKLTVDHIIPLSKGGSNKIDNIQPLCGSCNSRKGAKTIDYRHNRNTA